MVVLGIVLFTIALGASIGGAVALNSLEKALSKAISKLPKR
jgi:hypothetical protein